MHLLVFGTNPCAPVRKIEIYYHTAYASIVYCYCYYSIVYTQTCSEIRII